MDFKRRLTNTASIHHPVFWPSALLILIFISLTLAFEKSSSSLFEQIQSGISQYGGWFLVLVVNIILLFCLFLTFSKHGKIVLGDPDEKPEFSKSAWFAMLFSAGMGIGLLFWSVAEPIMHYSNPPSGVGHSIESAKLSMKTTFLHWGLHAWGVYALMGLVLAYFTFRKKLPLTISSAFHPLVGKKVHGPVGYAIDTLAVIATLFGLATSLGLGAKQINSGIHFLFGAEEGVTTQIIIIASITALATVSVVLGLKKGVKRLSQINIYLAGIFLLSMIIIGPSLFIFDSFVQNIGMYLQQLPQLGFYTESYTQTQWQNGWTIFYWAWWIAWSPFVGMFIARISRGRTIKEFILGVLIVPTIITFLWVSAFGGSALFLELNDEASIATAVNENTSTALFVMLQSFPYYQFTSGIGILLVICFFVTSSDSGSLVIDSITSGGKLDAPVGQKIFWATTEGLVASVLLIGGGLTALQTASIITGLPFAVVLLLMCYGLLKDLNSTSQDKTRNNG